jgi:hypothetical protein
LQFVLAVRCLLSRVRGDDGIGHQEHADSMPGAES